MYLRGGLMGLLLWDGLGLSHDLHGKVRSLDDRHTYGRMYDR